MNFLAHIHLSFDDTELTIGNFIADSIKGEGLPNHSARIRTGIALHRSIDDFTDHHQVVRRSKGRLADTYGHYSSVLVDIFYDHFLARNWAEYRNENLAAFAQRHYNLFYEYWDDLPEGIQHMLPYMKRYDWLTNYGQFKGMQQVLNGMSRRASFDSKMERALADLKEHHSDFEADFRTFFPELTTHVKQVTPQLIALEKY